jgi:ubiquitin C-terminal hydrolase
LRDFGSALEIKWDFAGDGLLPVEVVEKNADIRRVFFKAALGFRTIPAENENEQDLTYRIGARQMCQVDNNDNPKKLTFKGPTSRKLQHFSPPTILPIELARMRWPDEQEQLNGEEEGSKLDTMVEFPMVLNAGKYFEECLQKFPNEAERNEKCAVYNLNGMVIHQGVTLRTGHYYSYNKVPETGDWYRFDDSFVSKIGDDDAMAEEIKLRKVQE